MSAYVQQPHVCPPLTWGAGGDPGSAIKLVIGHRSMIDFVIILSYLSWILDTVNWSRPVGELISWQRGLLGRTWCTRMCCDVLSEMLVHELFNSQLWQSFSSITREAGTLSLNLSCDCKAAGACHGGSPQTTWWAPVVKGVVELKESRWAWLGCGIQRMVTGTNTISVVQPEQQ